MELPGEFGVVAPDGGEIVARSVAQGVDRLSSQVAVEVADQASERNAVAQARLPPSGMTRTNIAST